MVERNIERFSNLVNLEEEKDGWVTFVKCAEFDLDDLEDGVDGDGDLDDGLGAVEGRRRDQPVVRRLDPQLATPNLGKKHNLTHSEHN